MCTISYLNKNVEYYWNNLRAVNKDYGNKLAKKLSQRKDELASLNNAQELLDCGIDNPHMLKESFDGCIGWDLTANVRLILRIQANFDEKTIKNLSTFTNFEIEGVIDYHGENTNWIIH